MSAPQFLRPFWRYKHPSTAIDFPALGAWCRSRRGQVIVCEAAGATWLPFRPFASIKSFGNGVKSRTSAEVIWTNAHQLARQLLPEQLDLFANGIADSFDRTGWESQ